jgi:hypothetical protein
MFAHQLNKPKLVLQPRNFARTNRASFAFDFDADVERTGLAFGKFYNQTAIEPQMNYMYPYGGTKPKFTMFACGKSFELTGLLKLFKSPLRRARTIRQTHFEAFHYPFLVNYLLSFVRGGEINVIFDRFKGHMWKFGKRGLKYATRSPHFMRRLVLAESGRRFHGNFRIDSLALSRLALRLRKKSIVDNREIRIN